MIFHRQIQKIHPVFDCFDKETYLVHNFGQVKKVPWTCVRVGTAHCILTCVDVEGLD